MPRGRRAQMPVALLRHLTARIKQREIPGSQLVLLARWLDTNPEVPAGRWFKRFPELIVCGEGDLIKTFLRSGQIADGTEVG
jgi:hypothetical protein